MGYSAVKSYFRAIILFLEIQKRKKIFDFLFCMRKVLGGGAPHFAHIKSNSANFYNLVPV